MKNFDLTKLSNRENQVLKFILLGLKTGEIAKHLKLKSNTISTIKRNIFFKLQIENIVELYKYFLTS